METKDLFKNSLSYPLNDYKKLIILGVIFIIVNIYTIYNGMGGKNTILTTVLSIIGFIVGIISSGYLLSIIKNTIDGSDIMPDFQIKENLILGIKNYILAFIYFIIPVAIVLVVAWATGLLGSILSVSDWTKIPEATLNTIMASGSITLLVAIVLFVIFGALEIIGECRLAESNSLSEGLNIKEVVSDISDIGLGNFVIWLVLFVIISLILAIIYGFISIIPFIGLIISSIIVSPFIAIFTSRSMGLIYANK